MRVSPGGEGNLLSKVPQQLSEELGSFEQMATTTHTSARICA